MNLKDYEGKVVHLVPTGNNARGNGEKVRRAMLVKVNTVTVELLFEDRPFANSKMRFQGQNLEDGVNAGWLVFPNMQAVEDNREKNRLAALIGDHCRYGYKMRKYDLATLRQVAELLGVKDDPV